MSRSNERNDSGQAYLSLCDRGQARLDFAGTKYTDDGIYMRTTAMMGKYRYICLLQMLNHFRTLQANLPLLPNLLMQVSPSPRV